MANFLVSSNTEVLITMQESLLEKKLVLIFLIRQKCTKTARCTDSILILAITLVPQKLHRMKLHFIHKPHHQLRNLVTLLGYFLIKKMSGSLQLRGESSSYQALSFRKGKDNMTQKVMLDSNCTKNIFTTHPFIADC